MKRAPWCAAALLAAACADGGAPGDGRTQIYLTDAPFPYDSISVVGIYIRRIDVSGSADTAPGAAWTTVATPERAFNLLDYQGGHSVLLGEAALEAGVYRAVRVVIDAGRSEVVSRTGLRLPVRWPVAGELALHALVEDPLDVPVAGARLVLDFDVGRTFLPDSSTGGFFFIPVIRAVNEAATGTIQGSVTPDSRSLILWASFADFPVDVWDEATGVLAATTRTDSAGQFRVAFLRPGTYRVVASYSDVMSGQVEGVAVARGRTESVAIQMWLPHGPSYPDSGGGGQPPAGPVASVSITPPSQTISVGDSTGLMATTRNAAGQVLTGRTVVWTVSDTTVARVEWSNANWIILRARRPGATSVSATSEGVAGTASVVVR